MLESKRKHGSKSVVTRASFYAAHNSAAQPKSSARAEPFRPSHSTHILAGRNNTPTPPDESVLLSVASLLIWETRTGSLTHLTRLQRWRMWTKRMIQSMMDTIMRMKRVGLEGVCNYELGNFTAAQEWRSPCVDRSCLSIGRIQALQLYEHRKSFRLTAHVQGGKRDALRAILAAHYCKADGTHFSSFVVGQRNDICAAALGFACGVSLQT
eukprot:6213699-Pleurochrysis_carterae.AAC.2